MPSGLIDISVTLKSGMVHWPGDPPVKIKSMHSIARGDSANVSKIDMGSHTGTHMDAPYHFIRQGKGIDQMPLDATIGGARVIAIHDPISINPEELKKHRIRRGERILFKTRNSSRCWKKNSFVKDFVYISLKAAKFLAKCRIKTVGVDYLSVGGYKEDPTTCFSRSRSDRSAFRGRNKWWGDGALTHQMLLKAGIWIIEGLDLSKVHAGKYELICLPLKFWHGDGAPARAILRKK